MLPWPCSFGGAALELCVMDSAAIGTLGGGLDSAFNVNDRAQVVGVSYTVGDTAVHAVLWRDGMFTDLGTLGYDCSRPARINNHDQIVGWAFSCESGALSASIWEEGEMVDLNALIPADSGLQLDYANWIDDDGVIAAQGVLTAGSSSGDTRAVLLIPAGDCDPLDLSAAVKALAARAASAAAVATSGKLILRDGNWRIDRMWLRATSPAQLRSRIQNSSD
jgi:probable HAF family extracellular repeat protein